jgi:putative mycofactocin binding protein MftB
MTDMDVGAACFDTESAYQLHRHAELRDEPFGALAYHFGTRRLSFLKAPILVDVVRALGDSVSVNAALEHCAVPDSQRPAILLALAGLAESQMIELRT